MKKYDLAITFSLLPVLCVAQQQVTTTLASNYYSPSISANASVIAYYSATTPSQIIVQTGGTTTTITSSLDGCCSRPYVSRDGSAVTFYARANATSDVEPYIAEAPTWALKQKSTPSNTASDDYTGDPPTTSDNQGTVSSPLHYVAYDGLNHVGGKNPIYPQIYVWNESTLASLVASQTSLHASANSGCSIPVINSNGTDLAFVTLATNLGGGNGGATTSVFYSALSGGSWSVTSCPSGTLSSATWPSLSSNGQVLVFQANAEVYEWTPTSGPTIPYPLAGVIGSGPHALTECPSISPDGTAMLVMSNRNFTNSSAIDPYIGPGGVGQVGIECTFLLSLTGADPYLESWDYRSATSPPPGSQTACVLLEANYGSISNAVSGIYHGVFYGGEQYITPSQTSATDIFIF